MNRFAKTILIIYRALPLMVKRIDETVYNRAVKSHCNGKVRNTMEQMRNIITLIDKKRQLQELRLITEKTLEKLDKRARKLLSMRYIEGLSCAEMKEIINVSDRTFFRLMSASLSAFVCALTLDGFDRQWFTEIYLSQSWIKQVYNNAE